MLSHDPPTADLVHAAKRADRAAWRAIVDRYEALVWTVARQHGLGPADAADVAQATWLTLTQHLHRLRCPDRLGGWLATTAGREALRVLAARRREAPHDRIEAWADDIDPFDGPETALLAADRDREVRYALARLPERCQRLLRLIATAPELTYAQAARALGMVLGSVGPTRGRCLAALRRQLELADSVPSGRS